MKRIPRRACSGKTELVKQWNPSAFSIHRTVDSLKSLLTCDRRHFPIPPEYLFTYLRTVSYRASPGQTIKPYSIWATTRRSYLYPETSQQGRSKRSGRSGFGRTTFCPGNIFSKNESWTICTHFKTQGVLTITKHYNVALVYVRDHSPTRTELFFRPSRLLYTLCRSRNCQPPCFVA